MVFFFAVGVYGSHISSTEELIPFVALFILLVFSPFLMSLILSKNYPNLRIVSPFWLALVSFAEILIAAVNFIAIEGLIGLIVFGGLYLLAGYGEDRITTRVLGIAIEKEQIYFEHLHVVADIDDVLKQLSIPAIRNLLKLSDVMEGNSTQGQVLKTRKKRGENCACRLSLARTEGDTKTAELKTAYFEKGRYTLTTSLDFLEWARETSRNISDALGNPERDRHYGVKPIVRFTNKAQDPLIDSVVADLQGYIAKSKKFSTVERIKIVALIAFLAVTPIMFVIGAEPTGVAFVVIDVVLAMFETSDALKRRPRG